jgi:hypothetical protein
MIDLNIKLETNRHYINYANVFARLLILKQKLLKIDSFLIVLENEKTLNLYLKI